MRKEFGESELSASEESSLLRHLENLRGDLALGIAPELEFWEIECLKIWERVERSFDRRNHTDLRLLVKSLVEGLQSK